MCRWLAYRGSPVKLKTVLLEPAHSLIDQSLHAEMARTTTNGDGFGLGWYNDSSEPALYRSIRPAWNDDNLREVAAHVQSGLFFAHVRASTGASVQRTNCHPFRHGKWLWMHNGMISDYDVLRRDLLMAVDESLFNAVRGTTDSELMFYLALSLGLEEEPVRAVERMAGLVENLAQRRSINNALLMSLAVSDGERIWVFRYQTKGNPPSLYYSTRLRALRELYPDNETLAAVSDETRLIVSEPVADLPGAWHELPEATCGIVQDGEDELLDFRPRH